MKNPTIYEEQSVSKACMAVEEMFNLPSNYIKENKAKTDDTDAYYRFLVFCAARDHFKIPVFGIQRVFGLKSHSTILNGLSRVHQWSQVNVSIRKNLAELNNILVMHKMESLSINIK